MKKIYLKIFFILAIGIGLYYLGSASVDQTNIEAISKTNQKIKKKLRVIQLTELDFSMPSLEQLDPLTAKLLGHAGASIRERNNHVWDLKKRQLAGKDFEAIYSFLKTVPHQKGAQLGLHSLKNDLLTFVIDDGRYKESTAILMMDIINDIQQHEVMREYTLQYVSDYFEKHWMKVQGSEKAEKRNLSEMDNQLQKKFISTMFNMLEEKNGPIAGTALIKLHELSEYFYSIDSEEVEKFTKKMIIDDTMPVSCRMAALSVASERKLNVFEVVKQIAFDESVSIPLRMSALHTASTMCQNKDFFKKLEEQFINNKSAERRLKNAAVELIKENKRNRG